MSNPRELALKSLIKWSEDGSFSNLEINTVISRSNMEAQDSALYTLLYLGVIENAIYLDYVIAQYSSLPLSKIDQDAKNILRLSLYQLLFCDKIPEYSVVNEGVNLARKRSKGFVNGLLRSFIRAGKSVKLPKDEKKRFLLENSVPEELYELFVDSFGKDVAREILSYKNEDKSLSLRVNTLKATRGEIIKCLTSQGYKPEASSIACDIIKCNCPISKIEGLISDGKLFVQDESSRIASQLVEAREEMRVIDLCACPGGKSFSMAIDMKSRGSLVSSDLHKNKLSLIEKGAARLGIDIITTKEQDARELVKEYENSFDRVLCDVPCSGLGVIFKKPDIKYKSLKEIEKLPEIQLGILRAGAKYVKVGGYLVYSTCTLNKKENQDNIEKFLLENKSFKPVEFSIDGINSQGGVYTFLPHVNQTDGFFVAKMVRVE
ncbi:MAG: 16S rRNA (cytosine(967)-C(5))-methyltransferase RsmB [Clostridia bacterium]|nr:16S rRNA (cytosine(967)-C(5))-methyltransferase RsmB [Clostridia bacterium]